MKLKFSSLICFLVVFLSVFFRVNYRQESISLAAQLPERHISEQIINQIKSRDVIYLGENHDRPSNHAQELAIITQLQQEQVNLGDSNPHLAIAWEMFQRPFQPILDRYIAQEISEAELREQTEYDARWGFDWEFYAPILRFAQAQQIPLVAMNTPAEITRKTAETGINSLKENDFRYIPPIEQIKLDNQVYRQKVAEIYQQHVQNGQGNSTELDNFFAAQVLWDETMAEAIARYYLNHPQSQIIVLVGKAHVMDNYAIPERVARRINDQTFSQIPVLLD